MPNLSLASGQINATDKITVILVRPEGIPPSVIIQWPEQSTVSAPLKFTEIALSSHKVLALASTELARIRAQQKL